MRGLRPPIWARPEGSKACVLFASGARLDILRKLHSIKFVHTIYETHSFRRAAYAAGLSEDEIDDLVVLLAHNPMAGDEIVGTGGCRKLRVAGKGKGKSGGYRTITFYSGTDMPLFLFDGFRQGPARQSGQGGAERIAATDENVSGRLFGEE